MGLRCGPWRRRRPSGGPWSSRWPGRYGCRPKSSSCALGVAKPDPRAFLLALEGLGLAPEETLYLDDDPENVEAARRLGLRAEVYAPIGGPGRRA